MLTATDFGYEFTTPRGVIRGVWSGLHRYEVSGTMLNGSGAEKLQDCRDFAWAMFEQTDCLILFARIASHNLAARILIASVTGVKNVEETNLYAIRKLTIGEWARAHGLDPMELIARKP